MIVKTWSGSEIELSHHNIGRWLLGWFRCGYLTIRIFLKRKKKL